MASLYSERNRQDESRALTVVRVPRLLPLLATALILVPAGPAIAAPPNDNYLASTTINAPNGTLPGAYDDQQDTSAATLQPDLLDPDKNGGPLGGGPAEAITCPGTIYGKTVWYDFVPPSPGAVQIVASGFDAVVRVYEWNPATSQITRTVLCQRTSSGPVLMQRQIRRRTSYTVQIGGVNGAGGPLDFRFAFFPDSDGDEVLDEAPDKCPDLRGIAGSAGCPPLARAAPRIGYDNVAGGLQVSSLAVDNVAKGARISVSCRRCGRTVARTAMRGGALRLPGFVGRRVSAGDTITLRVTQPRTRSGRYRHGAIGRLFRWPVRSTRPALGARMDSCLAPGSMRKRTSCP